MVEQRGVDIHPVLPFINSLTIGINPEEVGQGAFSFTTDLPSYGMLKSATEVSEKGLDLFKSKAATKANKKATALFVDTETSGLGLRDMVRSLTASLMEIGETGAVQIDPLQSVINAHILTSPMQRHIVTEADGTVKRFGQKVIELETASGGGEVFDTADAVGRQKLAQMYKKFFQTAVEADYVVAHNAKFDFQKILLSASSLQEFNMDDEAVALAEQFKALADDGRIVNSLDLVRGYLRNQIVDHVASQVGAGVDANQITEEILTKMLAPETLIKAGTGGSVTPNAVSNIVGATNLLRLIEEDSLEGANFIETLARGGNAAHQANADTILTEYMTRFVLENKLKYGFDAQTALGSGSKVTLARREIMHASAFVPVTNIASTQMMSQAVFSYNTSAKGIRDIQIMNQSTGGIIRYDKATNSFAEYSSNQQPKIIGLKPTLSQGSPISPGSTGETEVRRILQGLRSGQIQESEYKIINSGINVSEASRADKILANISKATAIQSSTSPFVLSAELSAGNVQAQEAFVDALAGTRQFLGYNNYGYTTELMRDLGITPYMTPSYEYITDTAADNYLTKLAKSRMPSVVDDPEMRRIFTEIATVTGAVPYTGVGAGQQGGLAKKIVEQSFAASGVTGVTPDLLATRIGEFNANTGSKIGPMLGEMGISFFEGQQTNYMFNRFNQISRPIISQDILENIQVTVGQGANQRMVGLTSQEFMQEYSSNIYGLSVTERQGERRVNLVQGNLMADAEKGTQVIERQMAQEIAAGYVDQLALKTSAMTVDQAVEAGLFEDSISGRRQASEFARRLELDGGRDQLVEELTNTISERGYVRGTLTGQAGETLSGMLEEFSGENDSVLFQRGFQFSVVDSGDGYVAIQGRIPDKVLDVLEGVSPELKDAVDQIRSGRVQKELYDTYLAAAETAYRDETFRDKIIRAFSSKGLDSNLGIRGADRALRDQAVREAYQKIAPKVGIGLLAVGTLGLGYYITKKRREKKLYDETIKSQPTERAEYVQSTNDTLSQSLALKSTRRDPLVTAGVVGNLDRNKIGHTAMGPNKYDHLYGR